MKLQSKYNQTKASAKAGFSANTGFVISQGGRNSSRTGAIVSSMG